MALTHARAETRLPAQDLDRARRWYAEKLGLEPVDERNGGLRYECAAGVFCLFASAGRSDGTYTQPAFDVADIEAEVAELRRHGVEFEVFDIPGLPMVDGIAEIDDNYPSKGTGERGAWFRDSEGNLISLGQSLRRADERRTTTATLRGTSILLGTTDPDRLRAFYQQAFDLGSADEGWVQLGGIGLLVDERDDVAARNPEPGRVVLTVDTDDVRAVIDRLDGLGVRWICELEQRPDGWFSTFEDPDGNLVQVIQLNEAYFARRGHRPD